MNTKTKMNNRKLVRARVRAKISGTASIPRLNVRITNQNIILQLIDDESQKTLVGVTTVGQKELSKYSMTKKAQWAGNKIATEAKAKKIDKIVFDRGYKIYHGRVKSIAESARKAGLKF